VLEQAIGIYGKTLRDALLDGEMHEIKMEGQVVLAKLKRARRWGGGHFACVGCP
jgi:hypothetical protein